MLIQTALVARGLVCMNQSLASSLVDDRYGFVIGLFGDIAITGFDGSENFLD